MIELAETLCAQSRHPQLVLWVAWLVIMADHQISGDEALLMSQPVRVARDDHGVVDEQLANGVEFNPADAWTQVDPASRDLADLLDVTIRVASVDGDLTAAKRKSSPIFDLAAAASEPSSSRRGEPAGIRPGSRQLIQSHR